MGGYDDSGISGTAMAGPRVMSTVDPPHQAVRLTTVDQWWHLRELTLWRLSLTPSERVRVNADAYRWWRAGQVNHARALAARRDKAARRARAQ